MLVLLGFWRPNIEPKIKKNVFNNGKLSDVWLVLKCSQCVFSELELNSYCMLLFMSVNDYMDCLLNQTYLVSEMHGLNGQGALDQILVAVYGG